MMREQMGVGNAGSSENAERGGVASQIPVTDPPPSHLSILQHKHMLLQQPQALMPFSVLPSEVPASLMEGHSEGGNGCRNISKQELSGVMESDNGTLGGASQAGTMNTQNMPQPPTETNSQTPDFSQHLASISSQIHKLQALAKSHN
eukprot:TRINITY_DN19965_c0_g1_i1.p1 TRINITY_DN19965_c0_g1~~TRINITY_DN19965_c0_g1_i1.p1  ORF type:complete len:168 (-),score=48.30 TRINITY_DN19965_c0_g1_i1:33-473(-)